MSRHLKPLKSLRPGKILSGLCVLAMFFVHSGVALAQQYSERAYQNYGIELLGDPNQQCAGTSTPASVPGPVFVLGDSLGVGVTPNLPKELPESEGWSSIKGSSKEGRRIEQALDIVTNENPDGLSDASYILVILGTNPSNKNNVDGIKELLGEINKKNTKSPKIFWLQVNESISGGKEFNAALKGAGGATPIENTAALGPDGIHPANYSELAKTIAGVISAGAVTSDGGTGGGGDPSESIPGANNQEKAFRFFTDPRRGMSPNQAAGFIGNLMMESGPNIDPNATNPSSGAYGIAQWLGGRKTGLNTYASNKGLPASNFELQINYLWDVDIPAQINGGFPDIAKVTTNNPSMSVAEATEIIMLKFERPGAHERKLDLRIKYAEGVLAQYGSGGGSVGGSPDGCGQSSANETVIDGFVVYNQYDPQWKDKAYGSSTIGESGCGPSALAMVIATLGDKSVTPETIASKYGQYYIDGDGSSWEIMTNVPPDYGLTSKSIGTDIEAAKTAIRGGSLVIASGRGAKPFTDGGHFIVLRGVTGDGKLLIGDSGHQDTSTVPHEEAALSASIRNMWVISKGS